MTKRELLELAVQYAQEDECMGLCVSCGSEQYGCEPDARNYECESCGKHSVYGAEEIVIMFG